MEQPPNSRNTSKEEEKAFPESKFIHGPQDLYNAAAFFYYSPDHQRRFDDFGIRPITPAILEDLEVYKPAIPIVPDQTPEEFAQQRAIRMSEQANSAENLLSLIADFKALTKFLNELSPEPDSPLYKFFHFLAQFKDASNAYQLSRIPLPRPVNPHRYLT